MSKFDFGAISHKWWDPEGPMRPLHDLTPIRGKFILDNSDAKTAIDFGCGAGILTEWLTKHNITTTGIDISDTLLETAARHAKISQLEITYTKEISECDKVDLITCLEVLEHCQNHAELIQTFAQKLKPNGMLFISSINKTWQAFLTTIVAAEHLLRIIPQGTHKRSDFVKPSSIIRLAQASNMSLISASGIEYLPHSRTGRLTDNLSNNYILAFKKL